jgi:hypothetical protein
MYLSGQWDDYCTRAGKHSERVAGVKEVVAMYDSFSDGYLHPVRALLLVGGAVALAVLLQLL